MSNCGNTNDWRDSKWIGERFGHLVIIEHAGSGNVKCECDCGRVIVTKGSHLINQRQMTCGRNCEYHRKGGRTHGLSRDRLYNIWKGMKRRCYDPKASGYYLYGGRGIGICEEWRDDLFEFRKWALSHGYEDGLTIDRIDSDKGYSPDNCRWATIKEQNSHLSPRWTFVPKSKYVKKKVKTWVIDGVEKPVEQWCEEYGFTTQAISYRVKVKGMTPKEALTVPKSQGVKI